MVKLLPKRSIKALIALSGAIGLSALVIACLIRFPGQPTLPSRDYNITTRKVYVIAKFYCRNISYTVNHTKYPQYITEERQQILAKEIRQFLRHGREVTEETICQKLYELRIQEINLTQNRALKLRLTGLIRFFSVKPVRPMLLFTRMFLNHHDISFDISPGLAVNRKDASYSSNIRNWFSTVYTQNLLEGVRLKSVFNMYETAVSLEIIQRVAMIRGM
ncbi:MAG: hypothetical protein EZS28_021550 [Streblomastix strix]|uniref:Uncharacterized protein n=1 Tax=Streblomastix strix TaxID=222440 RepID=A0A5J4VKC7_9EUKA|nr:MAG: hypothetical protein EZS28_021550 [Streblomastix strix]